MSRLEMTAHIKIRPEQMEGFEAQIEEILRLVRELDTKTVRYDWFINQERTECEVHEEYLSEEGLIEHNAHVLDARATLFELFAYDHRMTAFGDVPEELRELGRKHAGGLASYSLLEGLDAA